MSDTPLKRRRLDAGTVNTQLWSNSWSFRSLEKSAVWPTDIIPVEIFDEIARHLPRSAIQCMRLVNKEFEEKLSTLLFRNVVVPFRPEIYGIADLSSSNEEEEGLERNILLHDKGMRVFQGFGRHIQKFAMSFEIDYDALRMPPLKNNQEAITTFWGIYRWPHPRYNRFHNLQGLEQKADETRTMTEALTYVGNAKELGLSLDAGLGWLSGPDINAYDIQHLSAHRPVFGKSRFSFEQSPRSTPTDKLRGLHAPDRSTNSLLVGQEIHQSFKRMLVEAGYTGDALVRSLATLLESEGCMSPSSPFSARIPISPLALQRNHDVSDGEGLTLTASDLDDDYGDEETAELLTIPGVAGIDDAEATANAFIDLQRSNHGAHPRHQRLSESVDSLKTAIDGFPLRPNSLRCAQKELLLETEWAQRAFMQSWTIAIADNAFSFAKISKLTIARLPSRHLNMLNSHAFWNGLSGLESIFLAVIPDWREITKIATGFVEDAQTPPSQAADKVHALLQDHVAPRKNITELHFEWLCGGEESFGLFSRNQLILPAPVVPCVQDMVRRIGPVAHVLSLPYIKVLSFKNCWFSPHICEVFLVALAEDSLEKLVFSTVSLCAKVPLESHPQPGALPAVPPVPFPMLLQAAAAAAAAATLANQQLAVLPAQPVAVVDTAAPLPWQQVQINAIIDDIPYISDAWLTPPNLGSWTSIIDRINPNRTLADIRHARDIGPKASECRSQNLRSITFSSCGYVVLPLDFDQTSLGDRNDNIGIDSASISRRRKDLEHHMMPANDGLLGRIVGNMTQVEIRTLAHAWGLQYGWDETMLAEFGHGAIADGIKHPGAGRFRGCIVASQGPDDSG